MCEYEKVCKGYGSNKVCDIVRMQTPVCFKPIIANKEPVATVLCRAGLEGLLEQWKKRSKKFEDNCQFGRDGDDDGSYAHGKYDMIDKCMNCYNLEDF
jgi:hypothetical protein